MEIWLAAGKQLADNMVRVSKAGSHLAETLTVWQKADKGYETGLRFTRDEFIA